MLIVLTVYMLGVIEESKENTQILKHHEAHVRFWLQRRGNTGETHTPMNVRTTPAVGHRHTRA